MAGGWVGWDGMGWGGFGWSLLGLKLQVANWIVAGFGPAEDDILNSTAQLTVIRTKNRFSQPREQVCQSQKTNLKYFNSLNISLPSHSYVFALSCIKTSILFSKHTSNTAV